MLPFNLPAALALLPGGAIACFAGQRLFRMVLALFGFIVGALAAQVYLGGGSASAARVAAALDSMYGGAVLYGLYLVLSVLVGGLIGASVFAALYFLGVALVGAGLGAAVAHVLATSRGDEPSILLLVVCGVVGAVVATALERYVLILATAFGGAWAALVGWLALGGDAAAVMAAEQGRVWALYPFDPGPGRGWVEVVWIVLGLLGMAVQLRWTAGQRGRVGRPTRKRGQ